MTEITKELRTSDGSRHLLTLSRSSCWKQVHEPFFRFLADDRWWLVPYHAVVFGQCVVREEKALLQFHIGQVLVSGPKTMAFFEDFAAQRATALHADGLQITDVQLVLHTDNKTTNASDGSVNGNEKHQEA
jgi:hypothetical protein